MILQYIFKIKEKLRRSFIKNDEDSGSYGKAVKRTECEYEQTINKIERELVALDKTIAEIEKRINTLKSRREIDFSLSTPPLHTEKVKIFKGKKLPPLSKLTTSAQDR